MKQVSVQPSRSDEHNGTRKVRRRQKTVFKIQDPDKFFEMATEPFGTTA